MAISEKTVVQYTTSDGQTFTDKDAAYRNESMIQRRQVFYKIGETLPVEERKFSVLEYLADNADKLVKELHKAGQLPSGYGKRGDF